MLRYLAKELTQIENSEKNTAAFNEAVEYGVALPNNCGDVDPSFEKALQTIVIPDDVTEEVRRNYITDILDKAMQSTNPTGVNSPENVPEANTYLCMKDEDYQKINGAITRYCETKDINDKIIIKKLLVGLLKHLVHAHGVKPASSLIVGTVNNAYKCIASDVAVTDETVDPKKSLIDKVHAVISKL